MVIFRLIGFILIILSLMLLGADLVSTLEKNGGTVIRSLDQILMLLGVDASAWAEQTLPPQIAGGLGTIISWPGWAVLGVPGALLSMIGGGPPKNRHVPPPSPPPISR
ncbi:MAG TPA: hypothetical protein VHT51_16140 [Micropepsaceae bacterium]|jgi:hypothetical protein|nr:hypothetical protein [Micropepsaceae bacterium]